jgi:predicted DNA-binding transcriptional regulator YafY
MIMGGHAENKRQRQEQVELRLLHSPQGVSVAELARLLDVDRSTIHRDLNEIEAHTALIRHDDGGYSIDPMTYMRNVRLSNSEALTIYIALRRFIRQTSHAPLFFATAIQKIATALRHPSLTQHLGTATAALDSERGASRSQTEVWNRLLQGWYERVRVQIDYQKARQSQVETHTFDPYLFEPAVLSHGVYVIGWSHTRGELRTFKIDRIRHVRPTAHYFEPDETIQPDDLLRHAWGVWYGSRLTRVVLRFDADVAARVQETLWHPAQEIRVEPDGSLIWSVQIAGTLELVSWIRGWGHEVEVLEPESLRQEIADSLHRAAQRYKE